MQVHLKRTIKWRSKTEKLVCWTQALYSQTMVRRKQKQTALWISLCSWQSLRLTVMVNRAWISAEESRDRLQYNKEIKYSPDFPPPTKTSIKKQIKSIIKSHGWAPPQLDWKDIKSSMTRNQIEKYGASTQKFIKKYNDKITEMNLPSSKQMPQNYSFNDVLSLSRFVNASPSRNVRKLMMSMDDDTLKQMMLNTLSLLFISKHREKYLNQRHARSRENHRMLSTVGESMRKKTMKYQAINFDSLPLDLTSHICSFLDPKSVSNVSFTCHSLCKASTKPAARSNTQISANQISLKEQLSISTMKQCRFVQSLSLNNLQTGYEGRFTCNFMGLIPNCQNLKSLVLDSISDKLALRVLNVVSKCIEARDCALSSLIITDLGCGGYTDIPLSLLKNLKTLTVRTAPDFSYFNLQRLWVNGLGENVPDIAASLSIAQYLHSPSALNLEHLILNDLRSIPMLCGFRAHPVFWLFNVPNLKSAELGIELATRHNFSDQCQIMLGKPETRRAAKAQTSFKSLTLKFSNSEGVFDWNSIFTNIRLMYPNLQDLAYNIYSSYWTYAVKVQDTTSIDWKMAFGGLRQIELGIGVPIETANDLLMKLNENDRVFRDLEVLKMKRVVVQSVERVDCGKRVVQYVNQCGMNSVKEFMSTFDAFLKHRAQKLSSLAVIFQVDNCSHCAKGRLSKDGNGELIPYGLFFRSVLELLGIQEDEHLERLQLNLEFGFRQPIIYDQKETEKIDEQFWREIQDHCIMTSNAEMNETEGRLKDSEEFVKLICKIGDKVKANRNGDKLIMKLRGWRLRGTSREFLTFWFQNEGIEVQDFRATIQLTLSSNIHV